MQKLSSLWIIPVLPLLLLASCAPISQPAEMSGTKQGAPPSEIPAARVKTVEAYMSCLSPALHMNTERAAHSSTLLPNGNVLIAGGFREEGTSEIAIGSAELFEPDANTFTLTGNMNEPRTGHTATLLPDGHVLLTGGWNEISRSSTAELYDPATKTFEYTGSLMAPRQGLTATLLNNGQVLIAGGDASRNTLQPTAELYNPATKTFTSTGSLNHGRLGHTATLLRDGRVLLVGGSAGNDQVLASAEIYDPATGQFTLTRDANQVRYKHSATLLQDGNVLILGGADHRDWDGKYNSAEIYDVKTETFTKISDMHQARFKLADAAVLLPDGNVLVGGGNRQIEVFDVQSQAFVRSDVLDRDYFFSVLTPLQNGQVLITGGYDANIQPSDKAWLFCK